MEEKLKYYGSERTYVMGFDSRGDNKVFFYKSGNNVLDFE